jgi:hypothetical protein
MPWVRLAVEELETISLGLASGKYRSDIARRAQGPTPTISCKVNRCGGRSHLHVIAGATDLQALWASTQGVKARLEPRLGSFCGGGTHEEVVSR